MVSRSVRTRSGHRAPYSQRDLLHAVVGSGSWLQMVVVAGAAACLGAVAVGLVQMSVQWSMLFLVAVIMPAAGLVIGAVRPLLLAGIVFDMSLGLENNLAYRLDAGSMGALGGWSVSLTTLCLVGLYGLWLGETLASIRREQAPRIVISRPLLLYVLTLGLSVVVAYDRTLAMMQVFLAAQLLLLFVYVASTTRTQEDVRFLLSLLALSVILQGLIMVAVFATGQHLQIASISTHVDASFESSRRVGGTLGSPNTASGFMVMALPPMVALVRGGVGRIYTLLGMAALALGSLGLFLTGSRGGLLAFGVAMVILGIAAARRGWLPPRVMMLIAAVLGATALIFGSIVLSRFLTDDGGAARGRLPLMEMALSIVRDHPLLGVGANNYGEVMSAYITPEFGGEWMYIVHNMYLLVWAEVGTIGFVLFLTFLLTSVTRAWSLSRQRVGFLGMVALCIAAAVLGNMFHMFVDVFNSRPHVQLLWLLAAIVYAIAAIDAVHDRSRLRRYPEDVWETIRDNDAYQPYRLPDRRIASTSNTYSIPTEITEIEGWR